MNGYAPVVIFAYKRLQHIQNLLKSLEVCRGAERTTVFIFCDAPVPDESAQKVNEVRGFLRRYANEQTAFQRVAVYEAQEHKGLAKSVIDGVTQIIEKYKRVIVLEDDLIVSSEFLVFMNEALKYYQNDKRIWEVTGFTDKYDSLEKYPYDVYFSKRAESWSWGTWINRWKAADWELRDRFFFRINPFIKKSFNEGGSFLSDLLIDQLKGKVDSWAVRWCYAQFKYHAFTVHPKKSYVLNNGFGEGATHTTSPGNEPLGELTTTLADQFIDLYLDQDLLRDIRGTYQPKNFHDRMLEMKSDLYDKLFSQDRKNKGKEKNNMLKEWMKRRLEDLAARNSYIGSEDRLDDRFLMGEVLLEQKKRRWMSKEMEFSPETWDEFGFRIFSQSNEDGLIQYLISQVPIPNKMFIEFGVESYTESNTRFLLLHDNWQGLVMDGAKEKLDVLMGSTIYWQHDLVAIPSFITRDNINDLILSRGFPKDIGILSVDIDGNDYWIWEAIDCIRPRIVICEYNPIYGDKLCVSIPYEENFVRTDAHYSNLYWGASLAAYAALGKRKGYKLVCTNQMGHNAFFVRDDIETSLKEVTVEAAYRKMMYRESRDEQGRLTYLSQEEGLKLIGEKEIVDITSGTVKKIRELL